MRNFRKLFFNHYIIKRIAKKIAHFLCGLRKTQYLCDRFGNDVSLRFIVQGNQVKDLNCSCSCNPHCRVGNESLRKREDADVCGKSEYLPKSELSENILPGFGVSSYDYRSIDSAYIGVSYLRHRAWCAGGHEYLLQSKTIGKSMRCTLKNGSSH